MKFKIKMKNYYIIPILPLKLSLYFAFYEKRGCYFRVVPIEMKPSRFLSRMLAKEIKC